LLLGFPIEVGSGDDQMQRLLKERCNSAAVELESRYKEFRAGRGTLLFLIDSAQRLRKAKLELNPRTENRIRVLQDYLDFAKEVEATQQRLLSEGRIPNKDYEFTRYTRLDAEIELLRAKRVTDQPERPKK
jgi:hypothetical protein